MYFFRNWCVTNSSSFFLVFRRVLIICRSVWLLLIVCEGMGGPIWINHVSYVIAFQLVLDYFKIGHSKHYKNIPFRDKQKAKKLIRHILCDENRLCGIKCDETIVRRIMRRRLPIFVASLYFEPLFFVLSSSPFSPNWSSSLLSLCTASDPPSLLLLPRRRPLTRSHAVVAGHVIMVTTPTKYEIDYTIC